MNAKQITSRTVFGRGLAALVVGLVALSALEGRAEHYTLQEQVLISGLQSPDTRRYDGLQFIRHRCAGVSKVLGLVRESSSFTCNTVATANGREMICMTGQIVHTSATGDQIFYSFQGNVTLSSSAGRSLYIQVIKGLVTVTGGTGAFKDAWGQGEATCVVSSDGHFSSVMNITLNLPGQK